MALTLLQVTYEPYFGFLMMRPDADHRVGKPLPHQALLGTCDPQHIMCQRSKKVTATATLEDLTAFGPALGML